MAMALIFPIASKYIPPFTNMPFEEALPTAE
jgi:hypothetical protein